MATKSYYLKFGLTGVQQYILNARTVRDYAAGSRILTLCMQQCLNSVKKCRQVERLSPKSLSACAHQGVFRIENSDACRVKTIGTRLCRTFDDTWGEFVKDALGDGLQTTSYGRLTNFPRIVEPVWVAVVADTPDNGSSAAARLRALYEQRKHTRLFACNPQPSPEATKAGCSLCAVRTSEICETREGNHTEPLCVPCAAKRHVQKTKWAFKKSIPSTHEFAAAELLDPCDTPCDRRKALLEQVPKKVLLGDERPAKKIDCEMQQQLDRFQAELEGRYYAVAMFDADDMGVWFSGEGDHSCGATYEAHLKTLGKAATEFAAKFDALKVSEGTLKAYHGGDDALMFLPLGGALQTVDAVRKAFQRAVTNLPTNGPTMSASLTIAHPKAPLQDVLREARLALEHRAKRFRGKNAIALTVVWGTGARSTAVSRWDTPAGSVMPEECDKQAGGFCEWVRGVAALGSDPSGLSQAFWYEPTRYFPSCSTDGYGEVDQVRLLLQWAVRQHGADLIPAESVALIDGLCEIASLEGGPGWDSVQNLVSLMSIMATLQRQETMRGHQ